MSKLITETLQAPDGSLVTIDVDYELVTHFICRAMPERAMITNITLTPEFIKNARWKSHRYQEPDAIPIPAFKNKAFTGSLTSITDDFQYRVSVGCKHRLTDANIILSKKDMENIYDGLSRISWLRFRVELIPPSDTPIPPFPLFGGLRDRSEKSQKPKKEASPPKRSDWNGFQVSTRAINILQISGCETLADTFSITDNEWLSYPNCGPHTLREIRRIGGEDASQKRRESAWRKLRKAISETDDPNTLTADDMLTILAKIKGAEEGTTP